MYAIAVIVENRSSNIHIDAGGRLVPLKPSQPFQIDGEKASPFFGAGIQYFQRFRPDYAIIVDAKILLNNFDRGRDAGRVKRGLIVLRGRSRLISSVIQIAIVSQNLRELRNPRIGVSFAYKITAFD